MMAKLLADGIELDDGTKFLTFECSRALWEPIKTVEGATVGTLLNILRGEVDFYSKLFDSPYLEAYLDETSEEDSRPLRFVEFRWYIEKWTGRAWSKDGDLSVHPDVAGVGKRDCPETHPDPEADLHYALDFTPIPSLAGLPIVVNDSVELHEYGKKKYEKTILGDMSLRLIDILFALVEEASFHGSPENRQSRMDDIKDAAKQLDADIASGEIENYPKWHDVRRKFKIESLTDRELRVLEILNKWDAEGLLKMGAPEDEYENEARMITEAYHPGIDPAKFANEIISIFDRQFGGISSYDSKEVEGIAVLLIDALKE
jgi:hypothetical protein